MRASAWRAVLCGIFALALALRVAVVATFQGFSSPPSATANPDQLDYEATAWQLATGHGFAVNGEPSFFRPPGTSAAIALPYLLFGRSPAAARVWFCALSSLTCVALAALGRRLAGMGVGLLAATALALDPAHLYYSQHLVSEVPYALLATLVPMLALDALGAGSERRVLAFGTLAGLAWGAATLVRPQALFALPALGALWALWGLRGARGGRSGRRTGLVLLAATLAAAAVIGAWMARNEHRFGSADIAAVGGTTFWGAHNERVLADPALCGLWTSVRALPVPALQMPRDEARFAREGWAAGSAFLRAHWRELPRLEVCKIERLVAAWLVTPDRTAAWAFALAWVVVAPLAAIGLVVAVRRDAGATAVAAAPLLALLLSSLAVYGSIRFRHSTEPILVLFAAVGLAAVRRRLAQLTSPG